LFKVSFSEISKALVAEEKLNYSEFQGFRSLGTS